MGRICGAVAIVAVIGVAGLASAPVSMSATPGLVAAYGFDEGSGTNVTDASGNGNTGTIANATWASSGKYGKALQFNGTSALVTMPDAASLHLSSGMTMEAWVDPSTVDSSWRDVIYKGNDDYYLEGTSTNASLPGAGIIAGGSYAHAFGTDALPANSWSYLAETYDGSTLRLYVNGSQVAATAHTGTIASSTDPLQIGGDSIYGQYFAGLIDEVRVYNVALNAAQIQTDQATPVNPAPTPAGPSALVAAYGFDEGSGTNVTDASGNGNTGTIANATWASSGKYGKALQFNGTSALVTMPDAASLHLSSGMTMEAWVDPSTVDSSWRDVIYKGNDDYYLEGTSTNASLPGAGIIAGGSYAHAFGTDALPANSWSYLAETYDGSTLRLYVNGSQVAATAHTGTIASSTDPLQIGGDSIYGQYFAGLIDEVRVYNIALNAAQIQTDQATPVNPSGDTTPPTQPGTLTATAVSSGEVDLSWGASTDNVGVTGYQVERCQGAGCSNFTQIATPTGTSDKDTGVSASTGYSYRVRATDADGNLSPYSNTAATTTTPATPSALVAAYAFDEGSGTTVTDASGNGNNGTITNATWATTGKYGKALQFNGTNALVTIPDTASLHLSSGMTLEAWVNPSTVNPNWRDVIYKGNDNFYLEATSSNGSPPDAGMIAGGSYADAFGTGPLPANTWSYLTETYDGSTLRLYVNGSQVAATAHTGTIASSTDPLQIGGDSIYGQYFAGLIDEVRVYNIALNAAQIQTDQATPVNPSGDTTPPTQPGTLTATAVSSGEVDLSWGASTDNVGVTGYQVERCQGAGCSNFTQIATPTGTSDKDTGVSASTGYSYRVRATDADGNLSPYSNTASATTPAAPPVGPGPLKIGPTGRYLVDQNNQPFLMVGDSPQSLIAMNSEASAASYFADRAAHGFNTVWINLLCTSYTFCNSSGNTYDGIAPFTSGSTPYSYDLSTPNPAYFQRVDDMINLAAQNGLIVILDPIETGGWLTTLQNNGATKDFNYGVYLGNRYKSFSNIIWMSGNDFQSWQTQSDDADVIAVANGIKSVDPNGLQTTELSYLISSSLDDGNWTSLLGLNGAYTYSATYAEVLRAYNESSSIPTFMEEANYEGEQNGGTDGCIVVRNCRLQEYWTMTSGATGQLYGSNYTDRIANGWSAANIDSIGVTQLGYETNLLKTLPWYNLVPDQSHALVTAGYGTFATSGLFASNDYATAAKTADGTVALVYMPTSRTITVDMSKMSGSTTARWFDPTNGTFTSIPGSPFANSGSRQFTPTGNNSGGDSDWLLVLQA